MWASAALQVLAAAVHTFCVRFVIVPAKEDKEADTGTAIFFVTVPARVAFVDAKDREVFFRTAPENVLRVAARTAK